MSFGPSAPEVPPAPPVPTRNTAAVLERANRERQVQLKKRGRASLILHSNEKPVTASTALLGA